RGDPVALERHHQPHAVAAEGVDVLGDRGGTRELAAEVRTPPPLADDVAIQEGASTSSDGGFAPPSPQIRGGGGGAATRTGRTAARLVRHSSSPRAAFAR